MRYKRSPLVPALRQHLLHDGQGLGALEALEDVVYLVLHLADGGAFEFADGAVEDGVDELQFEVLGKFLAVGEDFFKVDDQSHAFVELVVKELEDLEDVLADGHLLPLVVHHCEDVLLHLRLLLRVLFRGEREEGEADGDDVFYLHELLPRGHVEAPLLLDGVVAVLVDQCLIDLGLPLLVDPGEGVHLVVLLHDLLVVEVLVDDVGDAVAEVDEVADDEQLEHVLVEFLIEELLLVGPVEDEDGGVAEEDAFVVVAVVFEQLVDEVLGVQEGLVAVQTHIALYYADVVEHQLRLAVGAHAELFDIAEVADRVVLLLQLLDIVPQDLQSGGPVEDQDVVGEEVQQGKGVDGHRVPLLGEDLVLEIVQFELHQQLGLDEPFEAIVQGGHVVVLVGVLLVDAVGRVVEGLVEVVVVDLGLAVAANHDIYN